MQRENTHSKNAVKSVYAQEQHTSNYTLQAIACPSVLLLKRQHATHSSCYKHRPITNPSRSPCACADMSPPPEAHNASMQKENKPCTTTPDAVCETAFSVSALGALHCFHCRRHGPLLARLLSGLRYHRSNLIQENMPIMLTKNSFPFLCSPRSCKKWQGAKSR